MAACLTHVPLSLLRPSLTFPMSSTRNADAASITPYPPGITPGRSGGTHGESSDLSSPSKSRKGPKPRVRADRSSRLDEERFNVGPVSPRNTSASRNISRRATRNSRQDRLVIADVNDVVPNYPPPSFQEAISSPVVSVCPSTLTLVATLTSPVSTTHPSSMSLISSETAPGPSRTAPSDASIAERGSTSDSDDSLLIIESNSVPPDHGLPTGINLNARVRETVRHRRGVEFPGEQAPTTLPEVRGRSSQRPTPILDLAAICDGPEVVPSPSISSPKRRFLSLSPLRTIFPSKTPQSGDRPQTAHPTPGTSPYMQSPKGSTFFRSTTSLATASFLRLPLSSVANNGKPEKRSRLFGSKGKDKTKEIQQNEALDAWEELCADDSSETPTSLLSVVEAACKCASPTTSASPTRSVSFTYGGATPETYRSLLASLPTPQSPASSPPQKENAANSVHPLSLRDRKSPLPFVKRPVRRSPAPTPPRIQVPIPVPLEPVVTTVRTRLPPSSTAHPSSAIARSTVTAHVAKPSPLSLDSVKAATSEESPADSSFWKAVGTPLPTTPVKSTLMLPLKEPRPPLPPLSHCPPTRPTSPARPDAVRSITPARPDSASGVPKAIRAWSAQLVEQPGVFSRAPSPLVDEPVTPTRHHYPGRPLPRPPGKSRIHVDSTFAPNEEDCEKLSASVGLTTCPEGLLIDLDDGSSCKSLKQEAAQLASSSVTDLLVDLAETPVVATGTIVAPIPLFASSGISSFMPPLSSTPLLNPVVQPEAQDDNSAYSNITDLDLLASQLADDDERFRDGSSYDVSSSPAPFLPDAGREQVSGSPRSCIAFGSSNSALKSTVADEGLSHGSRVHRLSESPSRVYCQQQPCQPARISWRSPRFPDARQQDSQQQHTDHTKCNNGSTSSFSLVGDADTPTSEFSECSNTHNITINDSTSSASPSTIEELPTSQHHSGILDSPRPFQSHPRWHWQHLPARVY